MKCALQRAKQHILADRLTSPSSLKAYNRFDQPGKCRAFQYFKNELWSLDVGGLFAFGTLSYIKCNFLAFFERLESAHIDCGKVRKQIFAPVIGSDKTKTLCIVKPFYSACCHVITSFKNSGKFSANYLNRRLHMVKPVLQKL